MLSWLCKLLTSKGESWLVEGESCQENPCTLHRRGINSCSSCKFVSGWS